MSLFSLLALSLNFQDIFAPNTFREVFAEFGRQAKDVLKTIDYTQPSPDALPEYPYFAVLPAYLAPAIPGSITTIPTPCYPSATWTVSAMNSNGTIPIHLSTGIPTSSDCLETFLLGTLSGVMEAHAPKQGEYDYLFPSQYLNLSSTSMIWDIQTNGVRVFRAIANGNEWWYDLEQTLTLFQDLNAPNVSDSGAALNVAFMSNYANKQMYPRTTYATSIDPSIIQSGDFLGLIRLDGFGPTLAWAMGSATDHTTVAMRDSKNVLYVCESTTTSVFWPVNGIQCTEFDTWRARYHNCSYHITYAPLSDASRAKFNATAAWTYFNSVQGFDYGYYNFLYGWIDTISQNFPCLPPDFKYCLESAHLDILFGLADGIAPVWADRLAKQALNHRLGTNLTTVADIFYQGWKQGYSSADLYTLPEQDDWMYQTTRNGVPASGPSMVCCTFVCEMWKHAGLFDDIDQEVNCAELTNWDDYSLDLFDSDYQDRPQTCIAADPTNPCCQLEGEYTLEFNEYNSRDPYPHMGETCESQNPFYYKHPGC